MDTILFSKLHPDAIIPKRGTNLSAGFDLYALEDTLIVGGAGNILVPTGIAVKLPEGTYGRIVMRSGLALKQNLTVSAGVIDRDYTGPIGVLVSSTKVFDLNNMHEYVYKEATSLGWGYIDEPDRVEPCPITFDAGISTDSDRLCVKRKDHEYPVYPVMRPHTYLIKKGERFAQLIIEKVSYSEGIEVDSIGEGNHEGFGSTGKT